MSVGPAPLRVDLFPGDLWPVLGGPEFRLTSWALCPIKPQTWDLLSLLRLCMSLHFEALLMVLFSGFAFGATEAGASPKKDFASNLVELIASHSP